MAPEKIVIVGFGWVGQANALALSHMGYDVRFFDPAEPNRHYADAYGSTYEKIKRLAAVTDEDSENTYYMVCVGDRVADDGVQNIDFIKNALASLERVRGKVIVRSTILPDVLETLRFDYYVPEFLHEKKAVEECLNPFFFVLGTRDPKITLPSFLETWRQSTPRTFVGTPKEASLIKYLSNLWNSVRISFVNEFGDVIIGEEGNPEQAHRVINFVLGGGNYVRYGKGFGGHCLPKDTRAFVRWYRDHGENVDLLAGAYSSNEHHVALEKKRADLPEWYSTWLSPHLSGMVALRELLYSLRKNLNPVSYFRR